MYLLSVSQKCYCVVDGAEEERVMGGHLCLPVVKGKTPQEWRRGCTATPQMNNPPSVTSTEHMKQSLFWFLPRDPSEGSQDDYQRRR